MQQLVDAVQHHGRRYYDADTTLQLRQASPSNDALEKGWLVQARTVRNRPIYHYFAVPAIVLLTTAMLLRSVPYFIDLT